MESVGCGRERESSNAAVLARIMASELPKPRFIPGKQQVMTHDQLAAFAHQIQQFALISTRSISMHKKFADTEKRTHVRKIGSRGGYYDRLTTDKTPGAARPRWKPTAIQISILEFIFSNSDLLPGDNDIMAITDALRQYGPVEEVNVFYWFQNRRARAKRIVAELNAGKNQGKLM
ncbi:hypothetical protein O6H91_07G105600 [Diphasiastrum complanatum]|uniref:Uncharacterized protein n=1 Tax=Diphasiastrum complanatum TaxID=34168 RepID=A0ACC2D8I2_DIPCM|nr:hypothetical protein O6H91_07G105600 [Diphasiastrum complanatum]